jgi:hypothetical protein
MAFTGKATFSGGSALPEIAEDVSDIIGIVSPHETPLLDALGDPRREAQGTVHEWLEDALLPNTDLIDQATFTPDGVSATTFNVENGAYFQAGDQLRAEGAREVMLVTSVIGTALVVTRGYGGTTPEALSDGQRVFILGNAALEGDVRPAARFTNRSRKRNYTQIFTAGVEVSGSQLASRAIGVADEVDYQKQERLRELLRDLENCVLNGVAAAVDPQGSATVRRTMQGIIPSIVTNVMTPGTGGVPLGEGAGQDGLTEEVLNGALKVVWEQSSARIDTIVVNGLQKRKINRFVGDRRGFVAGDARYRDMVSVYESDFGVARVLLSRWVPPDCAVLLDSSRIEVLPLKGRSFHFNRHALTGDSEAGQVLGEYTLEMRNENAHGLLRGLSLV